MIDKMQNIGNDWAGKVDLSTYQVPEGKGKDAVWQAIFEKIDEKRSAKAIQPWRLVLKVAAVFVGLAIVGTISFMALFGTTSYYSPAGSHLVVNLPDGSTVNLNAESRLKFNNYLWHISRNVYLEGEGLFVVSKGKTFRVRTGDVTTQVLGTTFNVYARNKDVRVSCIEGKVAVIHSRSKQKVLLTPSQKTVLTKNDVLSNPTITGTNQIATWTKGEFYFQGEDIVNVFEEIERQFNVTVKNTVKGERYYSGVFFIGNLSDALDLVCIPMQLQWEKVNGTIIIKEKVRTNI